VSFLLRIFYSGYLFEDDGLWFTAAEEILRGKALYSEIYFDKPPALPILYALLFKLFGAHIIVIRVFTAFFAVAVAWVLYRFGLRLYGRRESLTAAAFFTVFSTTYLTGHMQGLNTDFLMTLPYTVAAYFFVRSCIDSSGNRLSLTGGIFAGIAFQINPKAGFDMVFFGLMLLIFGYLAYRRTHNLAEKQRLRDAEANRLIEQDDKAPQYDSNDSEKIAIACTGGPLWPLLTPISEQGVGRDAHPYNLLKTDINIRPAIKLFSLSIVGFVAGSLPFFIYIAATHSLSDYWLDVWVWGSRYADYFPVKDIVPAGLKYISGYFLLNGALLITLIFVLVSLIKKMVDRRHRKQITSNDSPEVVSADSAALLWFGVSLVGLILGGRFYGHYFFQILPALCLIGGRGFIQLIDSMRTSESKLQAIALRAVFGVVIIAIIVTFARFHTRTFILAYEFVSGVQSESTALWYHEQLNREELLAAVRVRDIKDPESAIQSVESLRESGPRGQTPSGPADYLFVWGYRPELYYWTGLIPASRYLSTQLLTGVPADVHYFGGESRSIVDEPVKAAARAELVRELEATRPKYIIDEVGMFNNDLGINRFAELREFMRAYRRFDKVERFLIYRRKDMKKKKKKARIQNDARVQEPAKSKTKRIKQG